VESLRYDRETNDSSFYFRSLGPSAFEVARTVIPMPNVSHLDDLSRDEIDQVQRAIPMVVFLPNLLQHYFRTYVSGKYLGVMMESNPEAVIFREAIPGQDH
jgi:hypothetical protein